MRIDKIDVAMQQCAAYLSLENNVSKEIARLLTDALLILICSEFEKKFRDIYKERCSTVSDKSARIYMESYADTALRGLKISEISGLLGRFGAAHKEKFKKLRDRNTISVSSYDSLIINRNKVAHGGDSSATFGDIREYYEQGHFVLDYFEESLQG